MWTIGLPSGTSNFLGMSETGPTYPTAIFTTDQDEEEEEAAFLTPLTAASRLLFGVAGPFPTAFSIPYRQEGAYQNNTAYCCLPTTLQCGVASIPHSFSYTRPGGGLPY